MSDTIDLDDLLTNEAAARLLSVKPNTLEIWRHKGKGPTFIKLGDSPQAPIRYLRKAVMAWLAERSFTSTSDVSASAARRTPFRVASPGPIPAPWDGTRRASSQPQSATE